MNLQNYVVCQVNRSVKNSCKKANSFHCYRFEKGRRWQSLHVYNLKQEMIMHMMSQEKYKMDLEITTGAICTVFILIS